MEIFIFYVFICVASLVLQSPILLNIHSQCQNINLISPVCFMHGGKWNAAPDSEVDIVTRNCIEFDPGHDVLDGVLVYNIQRKHAESDKSAQNESKCIQLLVVWHVEHTKELHVRTLLVEHDNELDEDKLRGLHQKYWHLLIAYVDSIKSNWLFDNVITLNTTAKVMNGSRRWDILISETTEYGVEKPLWIDETR
jgi:hypothetical protein